MSNLTNNEEKSVGKTVLELFKKVLQVKKQKDDMYTRAQTQEQIGGAVDKVSPSESNDVSLTKVEQYYDGTIYEGILSYTNKYDILFNIKDRTKGHFNNDESN